MLRITLLNTFESIGKKVLPCVLISTLTIMLPLSAWAADKEKDEETLKNAATVFQEIVSGSEVPASVLAQADCVIILPGVKKVGFGVGGSGGRGAMSCREGEKFNGKWSTPAVYSIGGASIGLQVGGSSTDFLLLVMNPKGVDAILLGDLNDFLQSTNSVLAEQNMPDHFFEGAVLWIPVTPDFNQNLVVRHRTSLQSSGLSSLPRPESSSD